MTSTTAHKTPAEIRGDLTELVSHLTRERDAQPRPMHRLGRPTQYTPETLRFGALSAATDHVLSAINRLSEVVDGDAGEADEV